MRKVLVILIFASCLYGIIATMKFSKQYYMDNYNRNFINGKIPQPARFIPDPLRAGRFSRAGDIDAGRSFSGLFRRR